MYRLKFVDFKDLKIYKFKMNKWHNLSPVLVRNVAIPRSNTFSIVENCWESEMA